MDWDDNPEDNMLEEKKGDTEFDDPPTAAEKLAEDTGDSVKKFTPPDDAEYPHPTEMEKVDPSDVE